MPTFDPGRFINRIGQRLIMEFNYAGDGGTPGLTGASREHPARLQIAKLLPATPTPDRCPKHRATSRGDFGPVLRRV